MRRILVAAKQIVRTHGEEEHMEGEEEHMEGAVENESSSKSQAFCLEGN